jgi:hypothetical protein
MLEFFVPLYIESNPLARQHICESLEVILPLNQIAQLEQKLGHIAKIFGLAAKNTQPEMLTFLRDRVSLENYVHIAAGLEKYTSTEFWLAEAQSLILAASLDSGVHCGVLLLLSALAHDGIAPPAVPMYLARLARDPELDESVIFGMIMLAIASKPLIPEQTWHICISRIPEVHDEAMILSLLHKCISILNESRELSKTIIRMISKLPNPECIFRTLNVQPLPYILPRTLSAITDFIQNSPATCDALLIGFGIFLHVRKEKFNRKKVFILKEIFLFSSKMGQMLFF